MFKKIKIDSSIIYLSVTLSMNLRRESMTFCVDNIWVLAKDILLLFETFQKQELARMIHILHTSTLK